MPRTKPTFIVPDYRIVVDTREQAPFRFDSLKSDAKHGNVPIYPEIVSAGLTTGDYSVEGLESKVAVERKSKGDFFSCCGTDRDRFENQLERLGLLACSAVVVEADWRSIFAGHDQSDMKPKTIFRSVLAWQCRLPRIHWWMCNSRDFAEAVTFRFLDRFYRDFMDGQIMAGGKV